ncbi:MAG: hypothetical protein M3Z57_02555 [Candidatus Dormibacteraeota bacterium]|nr:hypothetical protein [Candidatus Dormibacteraeota bacterium]
MSTDPSGFAFISLLRDELEARGLSGLLESIARPTSGVGSVFLVPDVRGRDFFAASARQAEVDRWWGRHVPPTSVPVYLLCHEERLAEWLRGLDGVFMVAARCDRAWEYAAWTVVDAEPAEAPLALARAAVERFSVPDDPSSSSVAGIFDRRDGLMVANLGVEARLAPGPRPQFPPLLHVDGVRTDTTAPRPLTTPDPIDLLVAESAGAETELPPWEYRRQAAGPAARTTRLRTRLPSLLRRQGRPGIDDAELAGLLVARSPTLVVIGSRKGGVGKTSHAAGIAIAAGTVLDSVGHRAAIVDANVANPDAWGQLHLPAQAATVRDVANALITGADPPDPIHAITPALACYPERREGVEYTRTEVQRLAAYLRTRYAFIVVDMSNRLPDPTAGPEAAVASYWLEEADALVLPTASSRQDFNGVLDYLDVPHLPPTVVPHIASSVRRNRRHPMMRHYLEAIGPRVQAMVEIPDEADSVRFAGLEGAAVQDVSPSMRVAYRDLTAAVARLPKGARA